MAMETAFASAPVAQQRLDCGSPRCVRLDQAMGMLGIGKTKLYELMASGELETIHIGRRRLVLQASIDALIERLRQQPK